MRRHAALDLYTESQAVTTWEKDLGLVGEVTQQSNTHPVQGATGALRYWPWCLRWWGYFILTRLGLHKCHPASGYNCGAL